MTRRSLPDATTPDLDPQRLQRESFEALVADDDTISVEQAIERLARDYQVSPLAITRRLTNLRILSSDDDVAG